MFLLAITDYIPFAITVVVIVVGYKFLFGKQGEKEEKKVPIKKDTSDEFQITEDVEGMKNGEMRELTVGELGKILLVKEKDEIHAIGNKCSHSSAPLKSGALCNGRIRCPWHGACFNVATGDIEDYPGLDSIQTFPVKVEGKKVTVRGKNSQLTEWKRSGKSGRCDKSNTEVVAIVGAGPAGLTCAETLRSNGYEGRIVLVGKEKYLPYDRTKLSKSLSTTGEKARLREENWFQSNDIELVLGNGAKELNPESKKLVLDDGKEINYSKAFVATGGNPRRIPVPGLDTMKNLFFLRVPEDAHGIAAKAEGANVVIVGSSFIGMEVASVIAKQAKSIAIIGMEKVPFERVLGVKIGQAMKEWHEFKSDGKITWYMEAIVSEINTNEDKTVREVILKSGIKIPCDLCVVGAGVVPATEFIKQTGDVKLERDQAVLVDRHMHAGNDLYAGGDIARYQFHLTGDSVRIEHYGMAQFHGKIAALNMLGKKTECLNIPFFWTTQYSKSLRYCGHALHYDDIVIDGSLNPKDFKFVGYFCQGNKVIAAVSMDRDPVVAVVAELLQNNQMISKEELQDQLKQGSLTFLGKL